MTTTTAPPEYNVTGIDYADRRHLRYRGPLIDLHAHVMVTHPDDPPNGPPKGPGPGAGITQAETMLAVAAEFGIVRTYSMCLAEDIPVVRVSAEIKGGTAVFAIADNGNGPFQISSPSGAFQPVTLRTESGVAWAIVPVAFKSSRLLSGPPSSTKISGRSQSSPSGAGGSTVMRYFSLNPPCAFSIFRNSSIFFAAATLSCMVTF